MSENEQIVLASRPEGAPSRDNFQFINTPLPEPEAGQVLVRTLYLSVDPYMRGRMKDTKSYSPPYALSEVIKGGAIGQVVESSEPNLRKGDLVTGMWGWQRYAAVNTGDLSLIDTEEAPLTAYLGAVGLTGLTAYFGMEDIGKPKEGETVVVSGAAGAVGMIAGQIAKIVGARVIGIAGSDEKCAYLKDKLGFDVVLNYKQESDMSAAIERVCPDGVDVYFDNVGGEISDAVLRHINRNARIPLCGQISSYNLEKPDIGMRPQTLLLTNTALMKGFLLGDYAKSFKEGRAKLAKWIKAGHIQYEENIVEGFEQTPEAFMGLFSGDNLGKQLVKVADPE
ncbi:NADPH-dependent curcumin reductase CurA [Paenibacillus amylolyticus]|uniref:NADPH-dependent curcumin reductase CurA n=1 Tax=Paenibacillus amylolyticus TaxID=1451 RepID=A0AAP5H4M5_PAEAM|nr:NADP-dependent oxidoreductase [Paenibacillus amylolyticus]MDR6724663.1 NADPH-dependent curcumin reductase CurA [Paenibacillus amylolyticus]